MMNMSIHPPGIPLHDVTDGATRLRVRMQWDQVQRTGRTPQVKVALLSTCTVNPLVPYLGMALEQGHLPADIWIGPYNQVLPQCLDPTSELARYQPDILVIWPRLEDLWGDQPLPLNASPDGFTRGVLDLADVCLDTARRFHATLLFVLPAIPELRPLGLGDAGNWRGVFAAAATAREALRRRLAGQRGVLLLDAEELVRRIGSAQAYNPRMLAIARIPFAEELFWMAGVRMARLIALERQPRRRVLVFDADNLLWGGELREVGPQGVDLQAGGPGEMYRQIQAFLLELRRGGIELALWGDYVVEDLWVACVRPEMRLQREHLAGWRITDEPAALALPALAQELGVALADLVVLTPRQDVIADLQAALPQVATIHLPDDPAEWWHVLPGAAALDQLAPLTAPEADEVAWEAPRQERKLDLQEFLTRLAPQVELNPVAPHQIAHVAHLTEQTADFHLTGIQRSEAELTAFCAEAPAECWTIRVRDRLGDYGIAGALLFRCAGDLLLVDTLLLNCRVLGRNVEYQVLHKLATLARERNCHNVRLVYRRTERNAVAGEFVKTVAGGAVAAEATGFSATLPVERLADLATDNVPVSSCTVAPSIPAAATSDTSATADTVVPAAAFLATRWRRLAPATKADLVTHIASDFRNGEALLAAVQRQRRRVRPGLAQTFVAPRTALESQLATVWAQVLGVDQVGVQDNFFHLGGHSILATQLVIQLHAAIGVELPIRIFFETPTVESMAQAIDIIRRTGDDTAFQAEAPTYIKNEIVLDPAIVPNDAEPLVYTGNPRHIFMTGATGFVGAFLLHDLLRQTEAQIACLVRANNAAAGLVRIRENLAAYNLWDAAFNARVIPVVGDLAQPRLGLSDAEFHTLASESELIYHAGAITSFIYPYSTLKPTNVLGTQEVLRLASQVRLKPVHFTSTLYVFAPDDRPEGRPAAEDDLPEHVDTMHIGYRQSKWVAERLVLLARERGIPVSIYRPARISGHSSNGACQTNDFVWRMIRACIEVNSVMAPNMLMDMVPVDYVSRAIVQLSLRPDAVGKVFHLTNPVPPYLDTIVEWVRAYGYPLRREAYDVWRGRLKEAAVHSRESAAYALIAFLPEVLDEKLLADLPFAQENTLAGLAGSSVSCPPITRELFHIYLDYFIQNGFLAAPPQPAERAGHHVLLPEATH